MKNNPYSGPHNIPPGMVLTATPKPPVPTPTPKPASGTPSGISPDAPRVQTCVLFVGTNCPDFSFEEGQLRDGDPWFSETIS